MYEVCLYNMFKLTAQQHALSSSANIGSCNFKHINNISVTSMDTKEALGDDGVSCNND